MILLERKATGKTKSGQETDEESWKCRSSSGSFFSSFKGGFLKMDIDFSLVLVILVGVCGGLWLLDFLLIKRSRTEAVENYKRTQVSGKRRMK